MKLSTSVLFAASASSGKFSREKEIDVILKRLFQIRVLGQKLDNLGQFGSIYDNLGQFGSNYLEKGINLEN